MISTTTNRMDYTGNGVATVYAYAFLVLAQADLKVYVDGILKTLTTDYSVSGVGVATGGNVTFVTAPANGKAIVILRDVPLTQAVDYVENEKFPADTHEQALDKLTMIAQQIKETFGRAIKFATTSTLKDLDFPESTSAAARAGKLARWNAAGTALELVTVATDAVTGLITTLGDLVQGGAGGVPERLAAGARGAVFQIASASKAAWLALGAKGGILVSDGTDSKWKAVGTDGQFLKADSTQVDGLAWSGTGDPLRQTFRGLHLRTHPDNDVAKSKVMLVHVDELITSNGVRRTPADRLVADIAVAGINGLRAGQAEAASTWYKVVYCYGGSGEGIYLEQAKNYSLDQSQTAAATPETLRNSTGAQTKLSEGFKVAAVGKIERVDINVIKAGSPTGNVWLEVQADDGTGKPNNTVLATSDKMDVSKFSTAAAWVAFVFRNPFTPASTTTQYHLVVAGDYALSDISALRWNGNVAESYANGVANKYSGTAWSADGSVADFAFKIYVTRNDNVVTPPVGYDTGYAQVGWVYNNSASDFVAFTQVDRLWRYNPTNFVGSQTATVPTLTDLSSLVPPLLVELHLAGENGLAASAVLWGVVPGGYGPIVVNGLPNWPAEGAYRVSQRASSEAEYAAVVLTEYQGMYVSVGSGTAYTYIEGWRW